MHDLSGMLSYSQPPGAVGIGGLVHFGATAGLTNPPHPRIDGADDSSWRVMCLVLL